MFVSVSGVINTFWPITLMLHAFARQRTSTIPLAIPCIVATTRGYVRGAQTGRSTACNYYGIPFAEPPTGIRRWLPPVQRAKWTNTFDASKAAAPACPQFGHWAAQYVEHVSEDCLRINLKVPNAPSTARPLLAMIHGGWGARHSSMDPRLSAEGLVRDGIVVSSFNYRLHIFGGVGDPAALSEPTTPPMHVYDVLLALTWLRDNAAAFGADAGRVTVLGWSFGGWLVGWLEGLPSAWQLYSRAVRLSSEEPAVETMLAACSLEHAAESFERVASRVGCARSAGEGGGGGIDDACMRAAEAADLSVAAQETPMSYCASGTARAKLSARGSGKPVIHAYVHDDVATAPQPSCTSTCAADDVHAWLRRLFSGLSAADAQRAIDLYAERRGEDADVSNAAFSRFYWMAMAMLRDVQFVCPVRERSASVAARPTWVYRFDAAVREPPSGGGGVEHGDDVALLLGSETSSDALPAADGTLAAAMRSYLRAFIAAETRELHRKGAVLQPAGQVAWEQWGDAEEVRGEEDGSVGKRSPATSTKRILMSFAAEGASMQPEPPSLAARCDFWLALRGRGIAADVRRVRDEYDALRREWRRAGYAHWPKGLPIAAGLLPWAYFAED